MTRIDSLLFEVERACKELKSIDKGHLADAVGQMYRLCKSLNSENEELKRRMDLILDLIDEELGPDG